MAERDLSTRLRKAVKENNLLLVKRLIQRVDQRNPDPGPGRYTSLAWAAVLGHEETFEFLLNAGHDDEELSKDVENNTILTLLADLRPDSTTPYGVSTTHPDLMGAALRMARMYYERYPYILEWSNIHDKTALHVSATKGNEELVRMLCDLGADVDLPDNQGNTPLHYASSWGHIPVIRLLIERGCTYTAKNNKGFTASDFAYSNNTMTTLQDAARNQFEVNKLARRQVNQQAAMRAQEKGGLGSSSSSTVTTPSQPQFGLRLGESANKSLPRLRSGSGGSRTTATSDGDGDGLLSATSHLLGSSLSSLSGSPSPTGLISTYASSSRIPLSQSQGANMSSNPTSSYQGHSHGHQTSLSSSNSIHTIPNNTFVNPLNTLSPITSRILERDADAMAEYKKRNRSGSAGTSSDTNTQASLAASASSLFSPSSAQAVPPLITNGGGRRLRPSASAAQLRTHPPPPPAQDDQQGARIRSGTNPSSLRQPARFSPPVEDPLETSSDERTPEIRADPRRAGIIRPVMNGQEDYTGPPSNYAFFPPPPSPPRPVESPVATSKPVAGTRRAAFAALLSKPLPSVDFSGGQSSHRLHRRGTSTSELRS